MIGRAYLFVDLMRTTCASIMRRSCVDHAPFGSAGTSVDNECERSSRQDHIYAARWRVSKRPARRFWAGAAQSGSLGGLAPVSSVVALVGWPDRPAVQPGGQQLVREFPSRILRLRQAMPIKPTPASMRNRIEGSGTGAVE